MTAVANYVHGIAYECAEDIAPARFVCLDGDGLLAYPKSALDKGRVIGIAIAGGKAASGEIPGTPASVLTMPGERAVLELDPAVTAGIAAGGQLWTNDKGQGTTTGVDADNQLLALLVGPPKPNNTQATDEPHLASVMLR